MSWITLGESVGRTCWKTEMILKNQSYGYKQKAIFEQYICLKWKIEKQTNCHSDASFCHKIAFGTIWNQAICQKDQICVHINFCCWIHQEIRILRFHRMIIYFVTDPKQLQQDLSLLSNSLITFSIALITFSYCFLFPREVIKGCTGKKFATIKFTRIFKRLLELWKMTTFLNIC